jgi:hypothetical protein
MKHRKYLKLFFPGALFFIFLWYIFFAYSFLTYSKLNTARILVVEGWISESSLKEVKRDIFIKQKYDVVLTTGFPYLNGFLMGSFGKTEFELDSLVSVQSDSIYNISVLIRGTSALYEYAHFQVYADSILIGSSFSTRVKKQYAFQVRLNTPPHSIGIAFDNDAYTKFKDRNLYLYSVSVNNRNYIVNSSKVKYYTSKNGVYHFKNYLSRNTAIDAANVLKEDSGAFPKIVAVESNKKKASKTYTTALDIKKWLTRNGIADVPAITIVSQGIHSRRSYISYRRVFGSKVDIGIICLPDSQVKRFYWYWDWKGWRSVIHESMAVLFAYFVL